MDCPMIKRWDKYCMRIDMATLVANQVLRLYILHQPPSGLPLMLTDDTLYLMTDTSGESDKKGILFKKYSRQNSKQTTVQNTYYYVLLA